MRITLILISNHNKKQTFTKDCMLAFTKENKTISAGQLGEITNIRYNDFVDSVLGDIELTFKSVVNGNVINRIDKLDGGMVITDFKPIDARIFIEKEKV